MIFVSRNARQLRKRQYEEIASILEEEARALLDACDELVQVQFAGDNDPLNLPNDIRLAVDRLRREAAGASGSMLGTSRSLRAWVETDGD